MQFESERRLIDFGFTELNLHRVENSCDTCTSSLGSPGAIPLAATAPGS